jgi:quinol monooxygenase YgiN
MKFGMQAVLIAADGQGDELARFMLEASEVVANLDGCLLYLVQQYLTDNAKILVTELWVNKESHGESLTNEAVRAIIMKAKPIIIGMDHNPAKYIAGHGI